MRQSQGEKFELMELVAENGDPAEIEQSDNLVAEQTKDHEALQESVNVLARPLARPQREATQREATQREARGITGNDAPNNPLLNTAGITANLHDSTTPTTKDTSAEAAEDGNIANLTAVKTSNVKGSSRNDPPDDQKKPLGETWKPPKMLKRPHLPFSGKNPPSGNGGNGGNGGNRGDGPPSPPSPPNSGGGRGDPNLHRRIDAKKLKMGGLACRRTPWERSLGWWKTKSSMDRTRSTQPS